MNSQKTYNAVATIGRISVGLQGFSSLMLAVMMLVTGSMFMGSKYDRIPAVVDDIVCDDSGPCGVAVSYAYKDLKYTGTFQTMRPTAYSSGDQIMIYVNPGEPMWISEDMPWNSIGLGMMVGAVALGYLSWYAIHLVSDNKNIAALAGAFTFLRALVV